MSLAAAVCCCLFSTQVWAQTGVDDDRVSLPEGPGSLEGVGENIEIDPNMGSMSYAVSINTPGGVNGLSPALGLNYSSAGSSSVVGVGWSLPTMSIERMTMRETPEYNDEDYFAVNGGDELVMVEDRGDERVYRQRFEGSFVRYTWRDVGDGAAGYWTAEYPDGSIGYYGAVEDGSSVSASRTEDSGRTYKYYLVEKVDAFGNRLVYNYDKLDGNVPLMSSIEYAFLGDTALYRIEFDYEDRDDKLSDAGAGFEELLEYRLTNIRVTANEQTIREYVLSYEDYTSAGGFSRLENVRRYGFGGEATGELYPIAFTFGYSKALGVECQGADCDKPYLVNMGQTQGAAGLATGQATLLDINSDGLPDILDTTEATAHKILINQLSTDGTHAFQNPVESALGTGSNFGLGNEVTQTIDVNGDGLSDLVNTQSGATIVAGYNAEDWVATGNISADVLLNVDLSQAKFLDYNNDKKIDIISSDSTTTIVYENMGDSFQARTVDPLGVPLSDSQTIQLSDMNGDGSMDVVEIRSDGSIRYRLNYGWGKWSEWRNTTGVSVESSERELVELEDLNGDGISDVVIVTATQVKYAINRNGDRFDPFVTITSSDIDGSLPERQMGDKVLYADMNANGSEDVVWFDTSGQVQYLELFPVRPNLLSRIENNIGSVQKIDYTTSAIQEATAREAGDPWSSSLSIPMNIVASTDTYVTLTGDDDGSGLHERVDYLYRDGFYDGVEKQFRGFSRVTITQQRSDAQEEGTRMLEFNLGREKPHFNGLLERSTVTSGGRTLSEANNTYNECDLEGIPTPTQLEADGRFGVYFACKTEDRNIIMEGAAEEDWVTLVSRSEYDGWGNVIKSSNLGVEDQTGDELFNETTFYYPGDNDRWFVGLPLETTMYTVEGGSVRTQEQYFYDGEDFVGTQTGLTHGFMTRKTVKADDGTTLTPLRAKADEFGNVAASIDANGDPSNTDSHYREYIYDDRGLFLTYLDVHVADGHVLRRSTQYEPYFQNMTDVTDWVLVKDGEEASARNEKHYEYDDFGRQVAVFEPGDDDDKPSMEFAYELGDPFTRLVVKARTERNGSVTEESYRCLDGLGRNYQTRSKTADGNYLVSGFTIFNARGAEVEIYQAYTSDSPDCETEPPTGVLSSYALMDSTFRVIEMSEPGEDIYGERLITRTDYAPLKQLDYDPEDLDENSPHFDTPTIKHMDGLGRTTALERTLAGGTSATYNYFYDETNSFSGYTDPQGNRHELVVDLAGRTLAVRNATTGEQSYTYDDAGNILSYTDARGVTTRYAYDGANRLIETWDEADKEGTLISYHYDTVPEDCEITECTNPANRLAKISYPTPFGQGSDRVGYDSRQRIVFQGRQFGDVLDMTTKTTFDNRGRITKVDYSDGTSLESVYDPTGRVTSVKGFIDNITYSERGLFAGLEYANGATTELRYDALQRLESRINKDGTGKIIEGLVMDRDRVGNILTLEDMTEREGISHASNYTYDAWYRVNEAKQQTDGEEETLTYNFDELDRLTGVSSDRASSAAHVGDMAYDAERPLALQTAGAIELEHDAAGQMTRRGDLELEWDYMARITKALKYGKEERHIYGADKARIAIIGEDRTVFYGFGNAEIRDGVSHVYVRPLSDRIARSNATTLMTEIFEDMDEDGTLTSVDAWLAQEEGADLGEFSTEHMLAAAASRMLADKQDAKTFLHTDMMTSLVSATDEGGEVIGQRVYSPTGVVRQEVGYVDVYSFTGQEYNDFTDLLQFKMRDLDPVLGRWASFDPAFVKLDPAAMSAVGEATTGYAYVAGNYANTIDPLGLNGGNGDGKGGNKKGGNNNNNNNSKDKKGGDKGNDKQNPNGDTKGMNDVVGEMEMEIAMENSKSDVGGRAGYVVGGDPYAGDAAPQAPAQTAGGGGEGQAPQGEADVSIEVNGAGAGKSVPIQTNGGGGGEGSGLPAPPQRNRAASASDNPGAAPGAAAARASVSGSGGPGLVISDQRAANFNPNAGGGGGGGGGGTGNKWSRKKKLGVGGAILFLMVAPPSIVLAVLEAEK